ncbi:hypothetical protein [Clostridium botulinum]|nr:hypothetical protein [Clostridium botulinum]EES48675.1 hypothetical protein CLO_1790 [Clostridium botulinum E1 str. 'BoNT E Beluga']MBY6761920.1 hypothetical protein [Clostridium botulinum]MBY6920846.1 hypothetical protein [Clostridium botulinum]MCR1131405.1 hypothetical protein [Clostridium botulinum]HBZ6636669.1 hypothetical protein [Clostridium botulinum]
MGENKKCTGCEENIKKKAILENYIDIIDSIDAEELANMYIEKKTKANI